MAVENLSRLNESYLKDLNLPNKEFEQVKYCIISYSKPDGFVGFLRYVAFRVWNAVKSLFGCSTWQQSVRIVKNTLINKVRSLVDKADISEDKKAKILIDLFRLTRTISKEFLQHCLSVNGLTGDFVPADRFNIVESLEETVQEICSGD